jgi:hypothetical protein
MDCGYQREGCAEPRFVVDVESTGSLQRRLARV